MTKTLYPIVVRGKTGYIDRQGEVVVPPVFKSGTLFWRGTARAKEGVKWGYIDSAGDWLIRPKFRRADPFVGRYAVAATPSACGVIDENGDWVVEPKLQDIDCFSENGLFAAQDRNNDWGVMNLEAKWVAAPGQVMLTGEFADGLAPARKTPEDAETGFVDSQAEWRAPPAYSDAGVFRQGLALVQLAGGKQGYIAPSGELVLETPYYCEHGDNSSNGFFDGRARAASDEHHGFIDATGRAAVPFVFAATDRFSEGLAAAAQSSSELGYIDVDGKWVIRPLLCRAQPFRDGLAAVFPDPKRTSVCGYIDTQGCWIWQPSPRFPKRFDALFAG